MKNSSTSPSEKFSEMDAMEYYLRQIGSIKPLSLEEESALATKIQEGDIKAKKKLVRANLRFVVSVARNYQNQGMPLSDIVNEGNYGLIKAAEKFDGRKNFKFISYAVWWVRQAILKALAEQSRMVSIPLHVVTNISNISKAQGVIEQTKHREATIPEIVSQLQSMTEAEIQVLMKIGNRHVSLDQPMADDKDVKLLDTLTSNEEDAPDNKTLDLMRAKEVEECLKSLKGNEEIVIKLYFGIGQEFCFTLEEIGQKLHLTRERVRQIKESALRKLKQYKKLEKFRDVISGL